MNIHEYQAKSIFRDAGIPILPGNVASSYDEAAQVATDLGGDRWVVKAQIHAGGRGVGHFEGGDPAIGGVRIAESIDDVRDFARDMLRNVLVTPQTGPTGREVKRVYIEKYDAGVEQEMYLAMLVDRREGTLALIASNRGGENIESVTPQSIRKMPLDIYDGVESEALEQFAAGLGLNPNQAADLNSIVNKMYEVFVRYDASLVEINPLAVDTEGNMTALDAVVTIDDNALFRHPELETLRDAGEFLVGELEAAQHGLNYVKLNGNIGCLASGAGLSLATIDAIRLLGGEPANFLDVPPVAQVDRVVQALRLVLSDPQVDCVLINVFGGGIMRCDTIADALIMVNRETPINQPLVLRLAGTNANFGIRRIRDMGPPAVFADDLADASQKAVTAASQTKKVARRNWWERVMNPEKR